MPLDNFILTTKKKYHVQAKNKIKGHATITTFSLDYKVFNRFQPTNIFTFAN
jgi:hypothetical protein